jgi:hypothetical protein
MAGLRWFDYQWLPADDRFIFGDLYVPAAGESQGLRWEVANWPRGFPATALPYVAASRLVVDSWLRGWIGFATDLVGERCSGCSSLVALCVWVWPLVLLFSVPATGGLGRLARMARLPDLIQGSFCFGVCDDGADDFRVEQRRLVGRELGIAWSGVAFSCEGLAIRSRWPSRLVADNARTRAVIVTLRIG